MKRKKRVGMVLLALFLILPGCGKKQQVPIEDYIQSNPTTLRYGNIMKSDTGYYYSGGHAKELSLHYYDEASGQNIFLCSKPECRHNGDAFCTATSSKYKVDSIYFYGGSLYLNVVENTDTEYLYKLLRVSADGTELTEVVTYMTVNNTSMSTVFGGEPMMIHRGVVVLPYRLGNIDDAMVGVTGTYLYNLTSGELTELPQLEYGRFSRGRERFTGYGDYLYYNTYQERKNTLSRYCITDGGMEEMELLRTYTGMFEVMDEDTIYYSYDDILLEYQISSKTNIEHKGFFMTTELKQFEDGEFEWKRDYTCSDMMTDGNYLYVGDKVKFRSWSIEIKALAPEGANLVENESFVYVYDKDLNEVAKVEILTERYLGYTEYFSLAILDGMVYLQTAPTVFACTLEAFLTEEIPPFEPVFDYEVDFPSRKGK